MEEQNLHSFIALNTHVSYVLCNMTKDYVVEAQALSCQPLTTDAWLQSKDRPCRICGRQSDTVRGVFFSEYLKDFPSLNHSTSVPLSHFTHHCYTILLTGNKKSHYGLVIKERNCLLVGRQYEVECPRVRYSDHCCSSFT